MLPPSALEDWTVLIADERWGRPIRVTGIRDKFLPFSIVSDLTTEWSAMLTALAASGHLAYDALCFVSLLNPVAVPSMLWDPNPLSATLTNFRNVATRPTTHHIPECLYRDHSSTMCLTSVFVGNLVWILTKLPTILVRWYFSQANARKRTLKRTRYCFIPLFLLPDSSNYLSIQVEAEIH